MERCRRSGWYRVVFCKVCYCTITCSTRYHTVGSGPAWRRRAGPVPTVQPYFVSPVSTVSYWLIRYLPCMIHPSCRLSGTEYIHTYAVTYALQNGRHDQSRVFFILVVWSFSLNSSCGVLLFSFCLPKLHRNPHIPSFSCILPHYLLDIDYESFIAHSFCSLLCSRDDLSHLDRSYHPLSPYHCFI